MVLLVRPLSLLRSLLLLGLPSFDGPLEAGRRQIEALHQANLLAFLSQHALLYHLLDDKGVAQQHLRDSLAHLEESGRKLQGLLAESTLQQQAAALQPLLHSYALWLPAGSGGELSLAALHFSESLLARALAIGTKLAADNQAPNRRWLALCGQIYAYSQRTICLLAIAEPIQRAVDRPALLLQCRLRCHAALTELADLACCHTDVANLSNELDQLHLSPQIPEPPWLHHVSSRLLHNLQHLRRSSNRDLPL